MRRLLNAWRNLTGRRKVELELDEELRAVRDLLVDEKLRAGESPQQAQRSAALELGRPESLKDAIRDVRAGALVDEVVRDVVHALRAYRRTPGFTAVVLLALALGIGVTTLMFTLVDGVLFRPLPFSEPERLVVLQERTEQATEYGNLWAFAYPNFLDVRRESRVLDAAAWRYRGGTVSAPGDAEYVDAREVSANLLEILRVPLHAGRAFRPEEDHPGAPATVILGYGLWQRQFGGDPEVVGRSVVFDGNPYTVVGVTPAGFRWLGGTDLLLPIGRNHAPVMQNRQAHPGIGVVARLRPTATLEEARADLARIGRDLADAYPASNAGRTFVADPLRADVGDTRATLWLLWGASTLVLLIACVNVASLLLARACARERELGMRMALGATRWRLARQCVTESATIGLLGGALGVLVAMLGVDPFIAWWPDGLPRAEGVQVDRRVLLFAVSVSLASGVLFGVAPALRVPGRHLDRVVRTGTRNASGDSTRLGGAFVVSQMALAVVLLVSAGTLGRTLLRLASLDPGLNVEQVLVARVALSPGVLDDPDRARRAWDEALERARRLPGVEAAAAVDTVPMRAGNNQLAYWPSAAFPPRAERPLALATSVTPGYGAVMELRQLRGRFIDERDHADSEPVVVIDEVLARQAFGEADPVGRRLWLPDSGTGPLRIVGVVRHVRHWGLAGDDDATVRAQLYYPFAQVPDALVRRWSELMSIAVRTSVDARGVIQPLQRTLRGAAGDQVLYEIQTMDQLADGSIAQQRFLLLLFAVFAGLALVLACIGIYGLLSYVVGRRIPEMGLRLALGATAGGVRRLVLGQSLRLIAVGVVLGTAAALGAGRALARLVSGVQPGGLGTMLAMVAVLVSAALLASYLPAWRASRTDPMHSLRRD